MNKQRLLKHNHEQDKVLECLIEKKQSEVGINNVMSLVVQELLAHGSRARYPNNPELWYPMPDVLPEYDTRRFAQAFERRMNIMGYTQTSLAKELREKYGFKQVYQSYLSFRFAQEEPKYLPAPEIFRAVCEILKLEEKDYKPVCRVD